jgi:dUTP pyrophosphatase
MRIKIKKLHPDAVLPKYAKQGDAGMDLTAVSIELINTNYMKYNFGLAFEIPEGFVGFIFPRSSCYKQLQILSNCVGVVDSGYRGEVSAVMVGAHDKSYKVGDRVAQLIVMPIPYVQFDEVDELSDTERGAGGYGSTGK